MPTCTRTRCRDRKGFAALVKTSICPSNICTGRSVPLSHSTIPRSISSRSTPARFAATRCPVVADFSCSPCVCSPRTRTFFPTGINTISSASRIVPLASVPVTTVPKPLITKLRSIGSRATKSSRRSLTFPAASTRAVFSSSIPAPVFELTSTTGAFSRNDPSTNSAASSLTRSSISPSTRSLFVKTISPF